MPEVGTTFGIHPDLGDDEQLILQAGIPLFQLVYPKPTDWDEPTYGFFGVIVKAIDPDYNQTSDVKWLTRDNAQIAFRPNRKRIAVAWIPDDSWWHNRLILMDQPPYLNMLRMCRLPDGKIKDATEIKFEIECMKAILKCETKIFKVFRNKREERFFANKQEAENYIAAQGNVELVTEQGRVVPKRLAHAEFEIVEGSVLKDKPEIAALKERENGRHAFGWTECREFTDVLRPQIIKKIKAEGGDFAKATEKMDLNQALRVIDSLPQEALDILRRKFMAPTTAATGPQTGGPAPKQVAGSSKPKANQVPLAQVIPPAPTAPVNPNNDDVFAETAA